MRAKESALAARVSLATILWRMAHGGLCRSVLGHGYMGASVIADLELNGARASAAVLTLAHVPKFYHAIRRNKKAVDNPNKNLS